MALVVTLNGSVRTLEGLEEGAALPEVVSALGFRADRIAVERNGSIVPRSRWGEERVSGGDKLEVVHFVGGGCCSANEVSGS